MRVIIVYQNQFIGSVSFANWDKFESYMLKWITKPVQVYIKFDILSVQIRWYEDVMALIQCVQQTQHSKNVECWKVNVCRFDQLEDIAISQVA
ncbi:hypothetical protein OKW21_006602 [Catalinimonas alkaloidigena]|uniref:hypothetical protein n=1 Tax=Catalinimonas alkaloidigena TaxID=1075417 RepID=UPI0024074494|nr:hypothetical protein [Catalinimonas alkaloidigena]MDF9801293.1 hypothetical protein [Catalinimonas alkaloidigena]